MAFLGDIFGRMGRVVRGQANAGVANAQAHSATVLALSLDGQLSLSILHIDHRVAGIAQQIQDDLLELDSIPIDDRKIISQFHPQDHAISLKVVRRQSNDFPRGLVQI